jgi:hypothetical protein
MDTKDKERGVICTTDRDRQREINLCKLGVQGPETVRM